MTIEEKIKNTEDLFRSYYAAHGRESFTIRSRVLEENGLGGKDFFDVICPLLKKEGKLKSYTSAVLIGNFEDFMFPEEARRLSDETLRLGQELNELHSLRVPGDPDTVKRRIREAEKELEDARAQFALLERFHSFEVNGQKLNELFKAEKQILDRRTLTSISLVSVDANPTTAIFVVLDEHYEKPIRFNAGKEAHIRKLYNIAYIIDAPGTRVDYTGKIADGINNGLFKRKQIREYMRTNHFEKPTLVQKSEDKKFFVLKNEIPIKTERAKNIPQQYQHLYFDKTK